MSTHLSPVSLVLLVGNRVEFRVNLADSHVDCLRGCLATLSILEGRIAFLEYIKIHEKACKFMVCEFGGF